MLARLLVVLLIEPAHQLLEDRAHAVIVESGMADGAVGVHHGVGAQVDVGRGELLDQRAERVALERRGIWLRNSKLSRMSARWARSRRASPGSRPRAAAG